MTLSKKGVTKLELNATIGPILEGNAGMEVTLDQIKALVNAQNQVADISELYEYSFDESPKWESFENNLANQKNM